MSVGIVDPHRDASSEYYTQNYFFAWWPLTMHVCSLFYRNASTWGSSIPTYMLYFILLYYASTTWGSTIPTYLTMYCIPHLILVHEYVGIVDPHIFISVYALFHCNTWLRGDRRSPRAHVLQLQWIYMVSSSFKNLRVLTNARSVYTKHGDHWSPLTHVSQLLARDGDQRSPCIY